MATTAVNGLRGGRGGGGRGGSPFRGGRGGRGGSPFRGGRGGSPFRGGRGGRGSPFRGRGGPFGGGRGAQSPHRGGANGQAPHRGGANGQAPHRGGANGHSPFRGGGRRGRGAPRGNHANTNGSADSKVAHSKVQFVEPCIRKGLDSQFYNFECLFEVTNLPTIYMQDVNELRNFIAEKTQLPVKKVIYRLPSETSSSVTAVCEAMTAQNVALMAEKLHGQVFRDRHLLVNRSFVNPGPLENCIKVFTQKPVATEVSEETLYSLFEPCGKLEIIRLVKSSPDSALEALITFGDSDSVVNALNLNAKLGKTKIHVTSLGQLFLTVSPVAAVYTALKDFKTIYVDKRPNEAYVYFSDKESYSNAQKLNGKEYEGVGTIVIKADHSVFIADPEFKLRPEQLKAVFGSSDIVAHPSRTDVHIVKFGSKADADNALKASPVLISNNLYNVFDSASKIPIAVKSKASKAVEEEDEDDEEEEDEDEDDDDDDDDDGEEEEEEEEAEDEEVDAEGEEEEGESEEEEVDAEEEEGDTEEEDDEEGEEEEDDEEQDEEEEEESSEEEVAPVPEPPKGKKKQQSAYLEAHTALKRKRNDSKTQGKEYKKQKA